MGVSWPEREEDESLPRRVRYALNSECTRSAKCGDGWLEGGVVARPRGGVRRCWPAVWGIEMADAGEDIVCGCSAVQW